MLFKVRKTSILTESFFFDAKKDLLSQVIHFVTQKTLVLLFLSGVANFNVPEGGITESSIMVIVCVVLIATMYNLS